VIKKTWLALLSTILLVTLLAGCGSNEVTESQPEGSPPAAGNSEEHVTLRFAWWGAENRHEALLKAIEVYEKKYPNVTIEAEYSGFDGYYQKLVTQFTGGTAPDLTPLSVDWIDNLAIKGNLVYDLNTLKDNLNLDAFDSTFLNKYTQFEGKLVGLPMGVNGMVLTYSKPFFEKFGISESTTWDWNSIHEIGTQIHAKDPESYLLAQLDVRDFLQPYVAQRTGGQWINEDKTLGFDEAALTKAFDYYKKILDDGVLQPLAESSLYTDITQNVAWQQGKIGASLALASTITKLKSFVPDIDVATYPIPTDAKATGVLVNPSNPLAINKQSAHPEEAAKFASWLLTDPEAAVILKDVYSVPPVEQNSELLADQGLIDATVVKAVKLALDHSGDPVNPISGSQELSKLASDYLQQVGFGRMTPQAAAKELIDRLNSKLKELE